MSVLEDARAVLATGPICDACLGRPFAERSFGLTNDERGRALRTTLALADDADYEPDAGAACWVCEGTFERLGEWAERAAGAAAGYEFETYQVGTRVPPLFEENDRLLREDAGMGSEAGESLKSALNREVGKRVGRLTGSEVDFERPDVLALLNLERGDVDLQVNPAFVYGRYRKLERDVPQTEWPCRECGGSGRQLGDDGQEPCDHCGGTGYMYPTSVEQEVAPHVRDAMDGEEGTFHGAGREDVDARMLGTGRPFVVEVTEPRRREPDLDAIRTAVEGRAEGRVEVERLRHATYEMVQRVKEHPASKTYRAAVHFDEPVDAAALESALAELDGATVEQYTPERVDHRRANVTRTREVYGIDAELGDRVDGEPKDDGTDCELGNGTDGELDDGVDGEPADDVDAGPGDAADDAASEATVEIHGEGGLYVKELISGDGGRTEPSLAGLLGVDAAVTALDVLAVEGEDEPFEDEAFFRD